MAFNYSTSTFLGETTRGVTMPLCFDVHTPIYNNRPPVTLGTGAPGSGKTFFALTLAAMSIVLGKKTIILDPKGDFMHLASIQDDLGELVFWNLAAGNKAGILDPFYLAKDEGEQLSLVISIIDMFVGGLSGEDLTALSPIVQDVIKMPNPSLLKVTEMLRGSSNTSARALGAQLSIIKRLPHSNLCFAPGVKKRASIDLTKGTTIINMAGLGLPKESELKQGENVSSSSQNRNHKSRFAQAIFFLITDYILRVMNEDESSGPKTVIMDEAWAIASTEAGAECIQSLALLGRSKQLALILMTQSTSHLSRLDIENTISTHFAFRTGSKEAHTIATDMGLPEGEGFEEIFLDLQNGECVMKDFLGRFSTVRITNYNQKWTHAFETNPLEIMRAKKQRAEAEGRRID